MSVILMSFFAPLAAARVPKAIDQTLLLSGRNPIAVDSLASRPKSGRSFSPKVRMTPTPRIPSTYRVPEAGRTMRQQASIYATKTVAR